MDKIQEAVLKAIEECPDDGEKHIINIHADGTYTIDNELELEGSYTIIKHNIN